MIELKFIDLFAGIGGFRLAAQSSDIENVRLTPVGACEIDENCRKIYEKVFNHVGQEIFVNDVQTIVKDNDREGKVLLPSFDLLFAGFPCQPFSNVGQRMGFQDPRGNLFYEIVNILKFYKPKFFILENVQKISTLEQGKVFEKIINELGNAGYFVHTWDLYADDYGLPQKRHRVFFCGVWKDHAKHMKVLSSPPEVPRSMWRYPTVWHLLERKMESKHIIPPKTRITVLRKNPKWQGNLEIDCPIARPLTATMAKWHRANQDNYYSATYVSENNPDPYSSPQVDLDSEPIRRITPLEGFRLQGFPEYYSELCEESKIPLTSVYRMIGNAVPVDLAKSVIEYFIMSYL